MQVDPHRGSATLIPLFEPKSVALVGAGPEFARYGGRVFHFLQAFGFQVGRLWHRTLCRRSQAKHLSWERMHKIVAHWLPSPRMCHPDPNQRLIVTTQGRGRMR